MQNQNHIEVDGIITKISAHTTRKGSDFLRVHVRSDKIEIDVDVFCRKQRALFDTAMPGDRLRARGPGFHRGPIHHGSTSVTAQSLRLTRDDAARAYRAKPQQLSLFAA